MVFEILALFQIASTINSVNNFNIGNNVNDTVRYFKILVLWVETVKVEGCSKFHSLASIQFVEKSGLKVWAAVIFFKKLLKLKP